jgi:CRP-like cAMP-binding protein
MLETEAVLPTEQRKRVERELFLRAMSPVKPPAEAARQIAQILRDVHVRRGDVLFQRGDVPKHAHYVVSGEMTLQGTEDDDITFGPGALIGIIDLNVGRLRARTAVATKDSHLLELPYQKWLEVLEDFPDFTSTARRMVATGLHEVALSLAPSGGFDQLSSPSAPASELDVVSRIVMLRRTRCFETASVQAVAEIAGRGEILRPDAGELLNRPGAGRERLLMVMRGMVHVERRIAPEIRATFGPGQLVLAGAAFSTALSSYAVVAGAKTVIFAIDHAEIDDVADDHFDIVRSALRGMSLDRDQLMGIRARAVASSRRPNAASR